MSSSRRTRRLLSLDGGGVRGLSIIIILEEVMKRINRGLDPKDELQPWEAFDMIGGTSTGGIIAIMLGRLRMTLQECKSAYLKLSSQIFEPRRGGWSFGMRAVDFLQANGKFDSAVLEKVIKETIEEYGFGIAGDLKPEDILLEDSKSPCKVFVCTVRAENSEPTFLRTYDNTIISDALSKDFKVWEACRATSAATTFFEPFVHSDYGQKFIDGGLRYNNPVAMVLQEAKEMWPEEETLLISVGTGNAPGQKFDGNLAIIADGLKAIATETENTAKRFYREHQQMVNDKKYFRFNVPGMASIGLQEHKEIPSIASASQTYLEDSETGQKLKDCATQITESLKEERQKFSAEVERECLTFLSFGGMDAREQNVEPAYDSTCTWIREHRVYQDWFKEEHGLLWISGKPGSGKSTLIKQALEFAREDAPQGSNVASFFFNSRSGLPLEATPLGMFRALICQMLEQRQSQGPFEELLGKFCKKKERHRNNDWQWQLVELKASFRAITTHPQSPPLYIYIDAIDECREDQARELTAFFDQIVSWSSTLSICISTRHTPYLASETHSIICMEHENNGDIITYVQKKLQSSMANGQNIDFSKKLVRKASGVFLWVDLVLKMLISALDIGATEAELKETLDAFPVELGELFQSMLDKIPPRNWPAARQLMQWVLYAERPLTLKELRYALAFSKVPPYDSVAQWEESLDFVGDDEQMEKRISGLTCGLAEVGRSNRALRQQRIGPRRRYGRVNGQIKPLGTPSSKVQFVHQSVKDFLVEGGILGKGHEMLMRSCVAYIATPDVQLSAKISPADEFDTVTQAQDSTWVSWPTYQVSFLNYAVNMCFVHAQKAECLEGIPAAPFLDQFYIPSNSIFKRWQEMYDQYRARIPRDQQGSKATLLHVASEFRLSSLVQVLLQRGFNVNGRGGKFGNALQTAAVLGYDDIAKLLLARGADINLQGKYSNALYSAAYGGHPETVELLLKHGAQVNEVGGPDGTALQVALHEGHIAAVKVLVQNGASLKQRVFEGQTPLLWSIRTGCTIGFRKYIPVQMQQDLENTHVAMIQYLLGKDAALEEKDQYGRTALLVAVYERRVPLVRLLVQYGANMEARDRYYGRTALILAAWMGITPLVQTLLGQTNIDIEARDDFGQTALLRAAAGGHLSAVEYLVGKDAKLELDHSFSQGERTALGVASAYGQSDVVRFLIKTGASLESISGNGSTPLISSAAKGHSGVVALLLENGANINAFNSNGETALLAAVISQSREIKHLSITGNEKLEGGLEKARRAASAVARAAKHVILLLIQQGADLEIQDNSGQTALFHSAAGGHILTTRFLLDHGAKTEIKPTKIPHALQIALLNGHLMVAHLIRRHGGTTPTNDAKLPETIANEEHERSPFVPKESAYLKRLKERINANPIQKLQRRGAIIPPKAQAERGLVDKPMAKWGNERPQEEAKNSKLQMQEDSRNILALAEEIASVVSRAVSSKQEESRYSKGLSTKKKLEEHHPIMDDNEDDNASDAMDDTDPEVRRKEELRARMAKMSGGMPMAENPISDRDEPQDQTTLKQRELSRKSADMPLLSAAPNTLSSQPWPSRKLGDRKEKIFSKASKHMTKALPSRRLEANILPPPPTLCGNLIICLGAAKVGKSSLLKALADLDLENNIPDSDCWVFKHDVGLGNKKPKVLELHNPRPFNRKMKPLIKGEGFILIFDVGDSMSFYTVTTIREDIVASYNISMRESFVILIGNKNDMPENEREVSTKCAQSFCDEVGWTYLELSASQTAEVDRKLSGTIRQLVSKPPFKGGRV